MNQPLPEGTHLAYHLWHEEWLWRDVVASQPRGVAITASRGAELGGAWEFNITETDMDDGEKALQINMFYNAWQAFAQIPELFAALAAKNKQTTFEEVVGLLDTLGAVDETDRQQPDRRPETGCSSAVWPSHWKHTSGCLDSPQTRPGSR
jgi:hypothetical protein